MIAIVWYVDRRRGGCRRSAVVKDRTLLIGRLQVRIPLCGLDMSQPQVSAGSLIPEIPQGLPPAERPPVWHSNCDPTQVGQNKNNK